MTSERRLRILDRMIQPGTMPLSTRQLCQVSAEITDVSGAGIMLLDGGMSRGSLCTTDAISDLIQDLQFSLGEGPCIDACHSDRPVLEPNLASPATVRWVAFGPQAVGVGVAAVFGFPVRVGAAVLGALSLYRDRAGPLTDEQHADAVVLADIAAEFILLTQADAPPSELAAELEASASLHYVVHQASGMVSVQLGVGVEQALVRLRAHAFGTGTPLTEIARAVVNRTLRFERDSPTGEAG